MLPRMQARRWSFRIALFALLLAAGGCHKKKASPAKKSGPGVHAADLKLDMAKLPQPKAAPGPALAGTLGMTLDELKKRWNDKAPQHHTPKVTKWLRQNVSAFQAFRAGARLEPGITLEVLGVGKDEVQTAQVKTTLRKNNRDTMFNAWETLREAVSPHISQDQLYTGLGLLSKPTSPLRFLDQGGYVWRFTYAPRMPAPEADVVLTVYRSQPAPDPGQPFSMLVKLGNALHYGRLGSFTMVYSPSSRGKTFEEAAKACDQQGLALCTDAQWRSACAQREGISVLSTWTASFNKDLKKLQTRGGAKTCDAGGTASATDKDPKRGAVCCTRNVAMTGEQREMQGLFAMPVLAYEQAADHANKTGLLSTLAPRLTKFYKLDKPDRNAAIKFLMEDAAKHPGRWSAFQTCELKAAKRRMYYLLDCTKDVFQDAQGMAVKTEYGIMESHIESLQDKKVLRKMGPI